ncbi:bifunctional alanine racemase/tRNA (adenosine(37)-N6)-threonylcarbamoyltransferase complex ATPase subunit type 1 TsaE, partial [Arthrobacter deserti]|nr:bifunctional alanine racemase/tRNA (adenosine(37)-N6)-threonylcarbamoyltransferase complex ATPase subunit type 1 TsaE [Arthrobacter deserti]
LKLTPAMTLRTRVANCKKVPADQGVSYGLRYRTAEPTTLVLVPMGYADGVPRTASGAQVAIRGRRYDVVGRVAMDQFVVDLKSAEAHFEPGEEVILFGPGEDVPDAADWAVACGTINYEIVTRISGRVPRAYTGQSPEPDRAPGDAGPEAEAVPGPAAVPDTAPTVAAP